MNVFNRARWFLVIVMIFSGCASFTPDSTKATVPMSLGRREMTEFVQRRAQLPELRIDRFQRDSHGEKLSICFSFKQNNEETYRTAMVTSNAFTVVDGAPIVFYNDLGGPVMQLKGFEARYDDSERLFYRLENAYYLFANGTRIPQKAIDGVANVKGGDCILLRFKDKRAWSVSRLANPKELVLDLPETLDLPECASLRNGSLVILGRSKLPKDDYGIDCLVYDETPDGFKLREEIPLPWANSVYDFDPESSRALLAGTAQKFAGYYVFNIKSKKRGWLGFAPSDNVLFLSRDLARALN